MSEAEALGEWNDPRVERVRKLLSAVEEDVERRKCRNKEEAGQFNVFEALGVAGREIYHSRFIGYLLNPRESHFQGDMFLKQFLIRLELPGSWKNARVVVEQDAGEYGRIDIVITLDDGVVIAIENKVGAGEGERQLERYGQWLESQATDESKSRLVFLTPDGRKAMSDGAGCRIVTMLMSYCDMADMLEKGLEGLSDEADSLRETVGQYVDLCRKIRKGGSGMTCLSDKVSDLLLDPTNLEAALEIRRHLDEVVIESIKQDFRRYVAVALSEILEASEAAGKWEAGISEQDGALVGLFPASAREGYPGYCCVAEMRFSAWKNYVGWRRPKWIDRWRERETEIERTLRDAKGGKAEGWWVNWRYINDFPDVAVLGEWGSENICAVHADNQDASHPLAKSLAKLIWSYFRDEGKGHDYFKEVEALEDFSSPVSQM